MGAPGPSDWLAAHPEPPQSFDDYIASSPNLPNGTRRVIYLLPLGELPAGTPPMAALADVVRAFFTLEVRILPRVPAADVRAKRRIHDTTHKRQLLAPDVLKWLARRVPEDAYALMAVTMEDLYPEESWNFVFGMASLRERVGVQSFARQDPAFFGDPREPNWRAAPAARHLDARPRARAPVRAHPLRLLGVRDRRLEQPGRGRSPAAARLPVCLRKLHFALDFDPARREGRPRRDAAQAPHRRRGRVVGRRAAWIQRGAR